MYTVIPLGKKDKIGEHDFVFTDFESFYKTACTLTVKLNGKWSIGIKPKDINDVKDFISNEAKYSHLVISIYLPKSQVEFLTMRNTHINTKENIKPFELFQEMCSNRSLLFGKGVIYTVYNSIEHDVDSMEYACNLLHQRFGSHNTITEKTAAECFIINKVVYPRSVVLDYLWMGRWREQKLKKCMSDVGNDIMLYAVINNIQKLFDAKVTYFKTGEANNLTKSIDTKRLNLMYRVFIIDRGKVSDVALLFKLYERGKSCYDFIQR